MTEREIEQRNEEPTYESHEYHPTRVDGLDRNLRKLNRADWNDGYRCICKACCEAYESSRNHRDMIITENPQESDAHWDGPVEEEATEDEALRFYPPLPQAKVEGEVAS